MPDRILIVDDEPAYAQALTERLVLRGYAARACTDPAEAIRQIQAEAVAVVILDLVMPEIDGIEVLRHIKRSRPLTEVILLTGHASPGSAVEGMRQGIFDYLTKDSTIESISKKIDAALACFTAHQDRIQKAREALDPREPTPEDDPW